MIRAHNFFKILGIDPFLHFWAQNEESGGRKRGDLLKLALKIFWENWPIGEKSLKKKKEGEEETKEAGRSKIIFSFDKM